MNKFDKFFCNFDYDFYLLMGDVSMMGLISSLVLKAIISGEISDPTLCSLIETSYMMSNKYLFEKRNHINPDLVKDKVYDYIKNYDTYSQTLALYGTILVRFNELCKIFDFSNEISIEELYEYMTHEGYLSVNKEIDSNVKIDNPQLLGAGVIEGHAVCRHYASMYRNISSLLKKNNDLLLGNHIYERINIIKSETDIMNKEVMLEIAKTLKNEKLRKQVISIINKKYGDVNNINITYDGLHDEACRHVVNIIEDESKCYIFDAFNRLKLKKYGDILVSQEGHLMNISTMNCQHTFDILKLSQSELENDLNEQDKAHNIIMSNRDILDDFYYQNKEIYKDIVSRNKILIKNNNA